MAGVKRILLAEDYEVNQIVIGRALETHGFDYDLAESGRETLEKLHSGLSFDLILMDIEMPEGDGFETARTIRKEFSAPVKDIPIVALTAFDGTPPPGLFQAFLCKPVEPETLATTIRRLTGETETPSVARVDKSGLLRFFDGDEAEVANLLREIELQLLRDVAVLEKAQTEKDYAVAGATAHRLKTCGRYLRNDVFFQVAEKLESLCAVRNARPFSFEILDAVLNDVLIAGRTLALALHKQNTL